jgi:iron complex outermembrane recepter protein
MRGHNLLGRWTRTLSNESELKLQAYYDRTWRDALPSAITDKLGTYDLDLQHGFLLGERNRMLWGGEYRHMRSEVLNHSTRVGILPSLRVMELFSGFLQDEAVLKPNRVKLTVGSRLEHNVFTGFEVQPSARVAWTPDDRQTWWSAVSRSVRSPSRIDVDYHIPAAIITPGTVGVNGGPDFKSEKVIAYELGYRVHPHPGISVSLATFYNHYNDIYSVEALPGTPTYEIQNGLEGQSWGAEFSSSWQAAPRWRLRGGYTYFHKDLWHKPGHSFEGASLGNDPTNQALIQSIADLSAHFKFDVTARLVSALPNPGIAGYTVFDPRLAWTYRAWEFSLAGRNLGIRRHPEFGFQEVPRSFYGKVVFQW